MSSPREWKGWAVVGLDGLFVGCYIGGKGETIVAFDHENDAVNYSRSGEHVVRVVVKVIEDD